MPFAYYGAKHGLALKYPPPVHDTIVEPFAGSAAYSVRWATESTEVILCDADKAVVELWHRVQSFTESDLQALDRHLERDRRTTDPLVAASSGSAGLKATLSGVSLQITPRMRKDWPNIRRRIKRALPRIRKWQVIHCTYQEAPQIEATWFIDPPYQVSTQNEYTSLAHAAGNAYRHSAAQINFDHLGAWCQQQRGQVIVCEQAPAAWLPFEPLAQQKNAQNISRTEVMWTNNQQCRHEQQTLWR